MAYGTVNDAGNQLVLALWERDPPRVTRATSPPSEEDGRFDALVDRGILLGAVIVGTALRVAALGSVGLNSDEAVYAGQAGSLAGNPHFTELFPVVRAHPLLFQLLASPLYRNGVPDLPGRYLSAASGWGRCFSSSCSADCSTVAARVRSRRCCSP